MMYAVIVSDGGGESVFGPFSLGEAEACSVRLKEIMTEMEVKMKVGTGMMSVEIREMQSPMNAESILTEHVELTSWDTELPQ